MVASSDDVLAKSVIQPFKKNTDLLVRCPKGECNRCGQIRTLNELGLCSSCEEWYERQ